MRLQKKKKNPNTFFCEEGDDEGETEENEEQEVDPCQPIINAEILEDTWEEGMDDGGPVEVGCIDTENGPKLVGLPPAYNYACRGAQLEHLCALEYMSLVCMDRLSDVPPPSTSREGRPKKQNVPLAPPICHV